MKGAKRLFIIGIILLTTTIPLGGILASEQKAGDPPARKTTLTVQVTQYEWWLLHWADNSLACRLFIDHEGLPTGQEILKNCGNAVYQDWRTTPPCSQLSEGGGTATCAGIYLYLIGYQPAEKTIEIDLPAASVSVSLAGCTPTFPENRCPQIPALRLTGKEPLPNEHITVVHAIINGQEYSCQGSVCDVPLQPTPIEGVNVEFWADSSFGDSSPHYTALVRVIDVGVTAPGQGGWYVDVLSSQWQGRPLASCAQTWGALPPIGGPPIWLSTPDIPALLASDQPYAFLAGRLIAQGAVNASGCPNGGLLPNGWADACGVDKALPAVQDWQNQFDTQIIDVAKQTGVPAQLMKNLFAQESQFWPGMFKTDHIGLGHITDQGAEALLLWNPSFYNQFCPLVLDKSICQKGYTHLTSDQQAALRGTLAVKAKTDCPTCPAGIDLSSANSSISLFAQTLLANCEQVSQEVYNASKQTPGAISNYEDLWKFTLANYHAGPGCLSYALYTTWGQRAVMDWAHVSQNFTPACQGVVDYVNQIAK